MHLSSIKISQYRYILLCHCFCHAWSVTHPWPSSIRFIDHNQPVCVLINDIIHTSWLSESSRNDCTSQTIVSVMCDRFCIPGDPRFGSLTTTSQCVYWSIILYTYHYQNYSDVNTHSCTIVAVMHDQLRIPGHSRSGPFITTSHGVCVLISNIICTSLFWIIQKWLYLPNHCFCHARSVILDPAHWSQPAMVCKLIDNIIHTSSLYRIIQKWLCISQTIILVTHDWLCHYNPYVHTHTHTNTNAHIQTHIASSSSDAVDRSQQWCVYSSVQWAITGK